MLYPDSCWRAAEQTISRSHSMFTSNLKASASCLLIFKFLHCQFIFWVISLGKTVILFVFLVSSLFELYMLSPSCSTSSLVFWRNLLLGTSKCLFSFILKADSSGKKFDNWKCFQHQFLLLYFAVESVNWIISSLGQIANEIISN